MSEEPKTRRQRFEDHSVSYKHVVYALPFLVSAFVAFGTFVLSQARAEGMGAVKLAESVDAKVRAVEAKIEARDAGMRDEVRQLRRDIESRQATVETKVERIDAKIDQVLKELRKR